jgi:hypothetical protein
MWLLHDSATAAAAAAASATLHNVVIDPVYLGGLHQWRLKEFDLTIIR